MLFFCAEKIGRNFLPKSASHPFFTMACTQLFPCKVSVPDPSAPYCTGFFCEGMLAKETERDPLDLRVHLIGTDGCWVFLDFKLPRMFRTAEDAAKALFGADPAVVKMAVGGELRLMDSGISLLKKMANKTYTSLVPRDTKQCWLSLSIAHKDNLAQVQAAMLASPHVVRK